MALRAILIDDEQKGIDALKLLIEKHITGLRVVTTSTSAPEGIQLIEDYKPEIVFLDINMPEMNGFEMLKNLGWKDFSLVFVTAYEEYALEAIKSNAIDYLLKPVDYRDLKSAIERIRKQMAEKEVDREKFNYTGLMNFIQQESKLRIIVNSRTGVDSLDIRNVIYLESNSNYTIIHFKQGESMLVSKTLKEFEGQLCTAESKFMRVHVSYIINLDHVMRFVKTSEMIIMANDEKIPLGKSRKDAFFTWLGA
jgi:two-component system LytT family response regulator